MGIERADIAIRLVEERTRCGISQADMARMVEISREGLRLYESGQRQISAEFLARAAGLGLDAQYVLTGIRSSNAEAAEKAAQPGVHISGGKSNVVQFAQSGSTVNMIATDRHVTTVKADVKPGDIHISDAQASALQQMVNSIVEMEASCKQSPKSHRAVWSALNAHCKVPKYRLIRSEDFGKAERYLRQWMGRLDSTPTARSSDNAEWRKRRYAYIKINCKAARDEQWLSNTLQSKYGASSLTQLSDEDLDSIYHAVSARKTRTS